MNPLEAASALVAAWARGYTRRLPHDIAEARRDELACDVWEQRTDAARAGVAPRRIAAAIVWRMLAGVPADLSWRYQHLVATARKPHAERIDGRVIMVRDRTLLSRARLRRSTRRCSTCGERYRRKLPYCPVCKTRPRREGEHQPGGGGTTSWPAGFG